MLSEHEQKIWDDIERIHGAEADEVARACIAEVAGKQRPRRLEDMPAVFIAGSFIAFLLVMLGAPVAGLAFGAATGLGLLLWRFWPQMDGAGGAGAEPITETLEDRTGTADQRLAPPRHRRLRRLPEAE